MKKGFQIISFLLFFFQLQSCYLYKAIKYKNFDLKDLNDFAIDTMKASKTPFHFKEASSAHYYKTFLDTSLVNSNSFSFLVIRNDTILYENYWEGTGKDNLFPTFSVSKSFVSTLVSIALMDGNIKSLQDPVTNYIPELLKSDKDFAKITIQHLLDMRSGIKNNEDYYNPSSDVLKMGFGTNIWRLIKRIKIERAPGTFDYKSANTQVLAIAIERATGKKIQHYLAEKLWGPLGMESDATWNIDSEKHRMVRAFCCINATMRDYAKLGRLFLNDGNWNGVQLLPNDWVSQSTHVDTMIANRGYKNQWWSNEYGHSFKDSLQAVAYMNKTRLAEKRIVVRETKEDKMKGIPAKKSFIVYTFKEAYHAEGLLGQYIYINPKKNLIIVRTGHNWVHRKFIAADHFIYEVGEKYF